ncbi:MAG TPA: hypothetical protein VJ903_03655 [Clostridia bacterium]|nr:hypothetical protein [Clostridia bacterium]
MENLHLSLTMDITINTVDPKTNGKSEVVEGLETFLEKLLDVQEDTILLDLQDTLMIFTINLEIALDLKDFANSIIKLDVFYNDEVLLGIYYVNGVAYLDLSSLGLFKLSLSGVDLGGLISSFLSGTDIIGIDGVDVTGLLANLLDESQNTEGTRNTVKSSSYQNLGAIRLELKEELLEYLDAYTNQGTIDGGNYEEVGTKITRVESLLSKYLKLLRENDYIDINDLQLLKNVLKDYNGAVSYIEDIYNLVKDLDLSDMSSEDINQVKASIATILDAVKIDVAGITNQQKFLLGHQFAQIDNYLLSNLRYETYLADLENIDEEEATTTKVEATGIVTIYLTNKSVTLSPNAAAINAIMPGLEFPNIESMKFVMNTYEGITNLEGTIKIDSQNNRLQLTVPTNGLVIKINDGVGEGILGGNVPLSEIVSLPGDLVGYGGTGGLSVNANGVSVNMIGLVNGVFDGIMINGLTIYLDKRTDYWERKEYFDRYPSVHSTGPYSYADDDAPYDGSEMATSAEVLGVIAPVIKTVTSIVGIFSGDITKIRDLISNANDLVNGIQGDNLTPGKFYRYQYARGKVKLTKSVTNSIDADIQTLTYTQGSIAAHVENHQLVITLSNQFNIDLKIYKLNLATIINGLAGPEFDNSGVALPIVLFPDSMLEGSAKVATTGEKGKIYGQVSEYINGELTAIENATVVFTTGGNKTYRQTTDKNGYYYFLEVPITEKETRVLQIYKLDEKTKTMTYDENNLMYVTHENINYLKKKGDVNYYIIEDKGNIAIYKDGYSSYYVDDLLIQPAELIQSHFINATLINATGSIGNTVTMQGKTYYYSGIETSPSNAELIDDANLTTVNSIKITHNGGANSTVSGKTGEEKGSYELALTVYNELIAYYNGIGSNYHTFNCKLEGYELIGIRYNGTTFYTANQLNTLINNKAISGGGNVTIDFILEKEEVKSITFSGSIKAYDEETKEWIVPSSDDYEIWIAYDSKTFGVADFYDLEPENFNINVDKDGNFSFTAVTEIYNDIVTRGFDLEQVGDISYVFKIRSIKYDNLNMAATGLGIGDSYTFTATQDSADTTQATQGAITLSETYTNQEGTYASNFNVDVTLGERTKHWSDEISKNSFIQRIRIRLGADIIDGEYHNDGDNGGQPYDNSYKDVLDNIEYEASTIAEQYNTYTYIELWLDSDSLNTTLLGLLGMLYKMIGLTNVAANTTLLGPDLSLKDKTETEDFNLAYYSDEKIIKEGSSIRDGFSNSWKGRYNEAQDIRIGDKVYASRGAYLQAVNSAGTKMSAGLVHYLICDMGLSKIKAGSFTLPFTDQPIGVNDLIGYALYSPKIYTDLISMIPYVGGAMGTVLSTVFEAVDKLLEDVSTVLAHVLPIQSAYSLFGSKDLPGSPIAPYRTVLDNDGLVVSQAMATVSDGTTKSVDVVRDVNTYDMSVYAKITLNSGADAGAFERITLFLNGASFSEQSELHDLNDDYHKHNQMDPNLALEGGDWNYNYWEYTGKVGTFFSKTTDYETIKTPVADIATDDGDPVGTYYHNLTLESNGVTDINELYTTTMDESSEYEKYTPNGETEAFMMYEIVESDTGKVYASDTRYFDDAQATYSIKSADLQFITVKRDGNLYQDRMYYTDITHTEITTSPTPYLIYLDENFKITPIEEGNIPCTGETYMQSWIANTNYNSYAVINEYYLDPYTKEKIIYNQFFVYDNEKNPKEDIYQELDIANNGIGFRKVADVSFDSDKFYYIAYDKLYKEWTKERLVPPTSITFHDPFDMTDFTAIGGTWANSDGFTGVRRNLDPSIFLEKILPNRYYANFTDGTSKGTQGVGIAWDTTALSFDALGTGEEDEYLKGYIGNAVYSSIKITVEPFNIDINDENAPEILKALTEIEIDPYNFNYEEFLSTLPEFFYYEYTSGLGASSKTKTYLFNDLVWSLDYQIIDGAMKFTSIDYSNGNKNTYIDLKFRSYGEDSSGNAYVNNTPYTVIKIPVKVKDYTISSVTKEVTDSVGGIVHDQGTPEGYHGSISFNVLNADDPYSTMRSLSEAELIENEDGTSEWRYQYFDTAVVNYEYYDSVSGQYKNTVIENWQIITDSFRVLRNADGSSLATYDNTSSEEQEFTVTYKVKDGVGNTQTIKILVRIEANEINNNLSYVYKNGNKVLLGSNEAIEIITPYSSNENATLMERLNLTEDIYVVYASGYEEKASLGEDYTTSTRIVALADESEPSGYKLTSVTVIEGEDFTYVIPGMDYKADKDYLIYAIIGKIGYTQIEMDELVTEQLFGNLTRQYSENKAINKAYDTLNESLSKYEKSLLKSVLAANRNDKVRAWNAWYDRFADEDSIYYSPQDVVKMDLVLANAKLTYLNISYSEAKVLAYEQFVEDNTVSVTNPRVRVALKSIYKVYDELVAANSELATSALKALTFDTWYNDYTRKNCLITLRVEGRVATGAETVTISRTGGILNELSDNVNIWYLNETATINTNVTWVIKEKGIDIGDSYDGTLLNSDIILKDNLLGNQLVRGVGIQVSQVIINGIQIGNDTPIAINAYDEKTIDDFLNNNYYRCDFSGNTNAFYISILLQNSGGSVLDIASGANGFNNAIWELATTSSEYTGSHDTNLATRYKVRWSYVYDTNGNGDYTDDGLSYHNNSSMGSHKIKITIQNKGYDTNPNWRYDVIVDLTKVNKFSVGSYPLTNIQADSTITDIAIANDNIAITKDTTYVGPKTRYVLALDPSNVDLSDAITFTVTFASGTTMQLVGRINLPAEGNTEFYNRATYTITNGLVFGNKHNTKQTFDVVLRNTAIREFTEISSIVYYNREGEVIDFNTDYLCGAFEDLEKHLPVTATITGIRNQNLDTETLAVSFKHIETYNSTGLTADGLKPMATAYIGDKTFGYVLRNVSLNIYAEQLVSVNSIILNDNSEIPFEDAKSITIDPYGERNVKWLEENYTRAKIVTNMTAEGVEPILGYEKIVSINLRMSDIDLEEYSDIEGNNFGTKTYTVNYGIGNTVVNGVDGSFAVRFNGNIDVTLLDSNITSLSIYRQGDLISETDPTESYDLEGTIYSQINFNASEYRYKITYAGGTREVITGENIVWQNLNNVLYTEQGGVYTVQAQISAGSIAQTIDVRVKVNKAVATDIVIIPELDGVEYSYLNTENDNTLKNLVIEPYDGFVKLPQKVLVKLQGATDISTQEVFVEWQYADILNDMTIAGGSYTRDNNKAAKATIYVLMDSYDEDGKPILDNEGNIVQVRAGVQTLEVDVIVLDRTIKHYEVSYDGVNYIALEDLVYSYQYNNNNFTNELLLNPYTLQNALISDSRFNTKAWTYSEKFTEFIHKYRYLNEEREEIKGTLTSTTDKDNNITYYDSSNNVVNIAIYNEKTQTYTYYEKDGKTEATNTQAIDSIYASEYNFAYFTKVRIACNGTDNQGHNYYRYYDLNEDNYYIYDTDRQSKTLTNNLYKGRNITMELTVGEANVSGANINELTCAKDARSLVVAPIKQTTEGEFEDNLRVRILDMSYESGLDKSIYYIDIYGIIDGFDTKVEYPTTGLTNKEILGKDSQNYFRTDTGSRMEIVKYSFNNISYNDDYINNIYFEILNMSGSGENFSIELKELQRSAGKINYSGGVGKLVVTFGNSEDNIAGGTQKFNIPVCFVDRTIEQIVYNAEYAPNFTTFINSSNELVSGFEFDPFVTYNNSVNGFGEFEQGYLKKGQYGIILKLKASDYDVYTGTHITQLERGIPYIYFDLEKDQPGTTKFGLTFNDSKVQMNYKGGYYTVDSSIGSGTAKQTITYPVNIKSRKVDKTKAKLGFSANVFKINPDTFKVKVYDYIGEANINRALINDIFAVQTTSFYVYFEGFEDPFMYTLGGYAESSDQFSLQEEESEFTMDFKMDTTQSISYKGGKLRFFLTLPGYGMGSKGQQEAEVLFNLQEQYVLFVNAASDSGNEYMGSNAYDLGESMLGYLREGLSNDEIEKLEEALTYHTSENMYFITNPYYFILQNGIKMPDKVYAYVSDKATYTSYNTILANDGISAQQNINTLISEKQAQDPNGIERYFVNTLWSGGSMGRVTINYNDTYRTSSFTMPIDDQVFKQKFKVDPWVFRTDGAIDAFTSTNSYGPEDIILLPTTSGVKRVDSKGIVYTNYLNVTYNTDGYDFLLDGEGNQVYDDEGNAMYDGNVVFDQYYSYVLHFGKLNAYGEEILITVDNVDGGGTYRNNYNKWYFGAIKFGVQNQYATLTLGGKGGQEIRWKFTNTSTRKWINSNVPNVVSDIANTEFTLPQNLIQMFNTIGGSSIQKTSSSDYIAIDYFNLRSATTDSMGKYGINVDAAEYTYKMNSTTYSNVQSLDFGKTTVDDVEVQILNDMQIALLDWTVLGRRAYPDYSKDFGGTIIVNGIGSTTKTYIPAPNSGILDSLLNEYFSGLSEAYLSDVNTNIHNLYAPNTDETSSDGSNISYVNSKLSVSPNYDYPSIKWGTGSSYRIEHNQATGETTQSVLPVINVLQGSKFELHNLPILGMNFIYGTWKNPRLLGETTYTRGSGVTGTYLPWYKADAYIITSHDFGISNGVLVGDKRKLSDGNDVMYIDTCVDDGTRYLLTCNFELPLITETDAKKLRQRADNGTGSALARSNVRFTIHIIVRIVEEL